MPLMFVYMFGLEYFRESTGAMYTGVGNDPDCGWVDESAGVPGTGENGVTLKLLGDLLVAVVGDPMNETRRANADVDAMRCNNGAFCNIGDLSVALPALLFLVRADLK